MFKGILCPVDFDSKSLEALRMARDLAMREQASIEVLHVRPPNDPTVISPTSIGREAKNMLGGNCDRSQTKSLCESTTKSCCAGHPAKEIIKAAEEVQADLVVMATHGRTGMSHLVLGSVTEEVVRRSPCAVLAIRMKPRPQISQGG